MRRPYDLPPLTALSAFEAAARLGGVKRAAESLNVTPGAVSRQVKALESDLGCALFERLHRGVELTPEGRELAETLADGLARVAEVCRRLRGRGDTPTLTVGATTAFAGFWLMPRIGGFWQDNPDVAVDHVISDDPIDPLRRQVDFAFRYGTGEWPGLSSVLLFGDSLFPVCSPSLAAKFGQVAAQDLPGLPLLRLKGVDPSWIDWPSFFAEMGLVDTGAGRGMNNYAVVVQAALDGQGVALGWNSLVAPQLRAGTLVRLTDLSMPAPGAHYLVSADGRDPTPAMVAFAEWVRSVSVD